MFFVLSISLKYVPGGDPFNLVVEPENKLVFLTTVNVVDQFETHLYQDGKMSLKFLEEELRSELTLIAIRKFSPFFEEFKMRIQMMVETEFKVLSTNGNSKHFRDQHEKINDSVPALILSIDDLKIGFLVCCVPLALSVVIFFCEVLRPKLLALAMKARDLLTFLYVIRTVPKLKDLAHK